MASFLNVLDEAAKYVDKAKIDLVVTDVYLKSLGADGLTGTELEEAIQQARNELVCDGADHINQLRYDVENGNLSGTYVALADLIDEVISGINRAANELTGGAFKLEEDARYSTKVESRKSYDGISLAEDSKAYTYDFMTAQPDMTVAEMPALASIKDGDSISRGKAVSLGLENAEALGHKVSDSVVAVKNDYTERDIRIGRSALEHGLYGDNVSRLRTNARLAAIAGDIVKNAIPVNALTNKNAQVFGTYAMAALLQSGDRHVVAIVTVEQYKNSVDNIDYIDVTHAISGRLEKENSRRSSTRETGFLKPSTSAVRISIANFLEIVNTTHRSILSDDVLHHFGETRPEDGYYAGRVKFSQKMPTAADTDSTGASLSDGQRSYFADSKVRDAQGRLKVMYRGGNGDYTVFDRRKSKPSNLLF